MKTAKSCRRFVALAAAYVIALQALLLPLSIAANAAFTTSLCTAATQGSQAPGHESGCPCAAGCGMQCCGQTLAGAPQLEVVVARTYSRLTPAVPAFEAIARPPAKGPQLARAPPA